MKLKHLPFLFLSRIGFYKEREFDFRYRKNQGDPPFYIIRRANHWGEAGFFSNYFYVLAHYAYALRRGYRPVVDMRNYRTLYSERHPIQGERNAWNYYFRQPYSTQEAYGSHHFILSGHTPHQEFNPILETDDICDLNPETFPLLYKIAQTELSIRRELTTEFESEFTKLFGSHKILGIHFRGGDKHAPPAGHRMSISEENLLLALEELLEAKPDAIFLASDEVGIAALLQSRTNLPVVQLPACRLSSGSHEGLHLQKDPIRRPMHRYLLGLEVLRDAWFLSRCNFLIYGHSNVSNAALFLRGKTYEEKKLVRSGSPAV